MPFQWTNPQFTFSSSREWQQLPTDSQSVLQLFCPYMETTLTLSMEPSQVPWEQLQAAARELLAQRKHALVHAVQQRGEGVQFTSELVQAHVSGSAYGYSYEAQQPGRAYLGFLGYVSPQRHIGLFVDTKVSFVPGCAQMFREVAGGFEFALP